MQHPLEQDLQHILENTQSVWPRLKSANILLTGASGFVGSWLVESFLWANHHLRLNARLFVLTRNPNAFPAARPNLEVLIGDLKTLRFPATQCRYVIHAAIEHQTPDQGVAANLEANWLSLDRIITIARNHGTEKLLFTSSGAVYGLQPVNILALAEDFAGNIDPRNVYAVVKRVSEQALANETNAVIARLFAFVGPYLPLDRNFAAGNFIRDALAGGPIHIEGDGTPRRSYLYAADLAIWLWTLLVQGQAARSYNVGSDQSVSMLELAQTVDRVCSVTRGISLGKMPVPGIQPHRYIPSIARARSELNLHPLIALDEGIRRTFEWHRQNQTSTK